VTSINEQGIASGHRARRAPTQHNARGVLWSVVAAAAYSSSTVVGKSLLGVLGVASLLLWRFVIASAVLWALVLARRHRRGPDRSTVPRARLFALGMLFGGVVGSGFVALQRLDASVYIVLIYLYPVFVVLGSTLIGVPPARGTWIALVLVLVGVVLTVPELFTGVGTVSALGVALALLQAVLLAGYMLICSRSLESVDGLTSAAWTMLGSAAMMLPFALVGGLRTPDTGELRAKVLLFAIVPTVIATLALFRAMQLVSAGVVSMAMPLEVVLAIVWSVIFLGEDLGAIQAVGAAVVVAGVVVAQWVNGRSVSSSPRDPREHHGTVEPR
jgi:drug/metabolite transporter (DMT)-like permease